MSVVSPLVLVMIGVLIHGSCAIKCYQCSSEYGKECDDPLDTSKVSDGTCPHSSHKSCAKMKGTAKRSGTSERKGGVMRYCSTENKNTCDRVNDKSFPEFHVEGAEGDLCYCTGDLCNAAPPTSIGHLTVSFIGVVSVLSLTAARLLSQ